jgi:hypothetical protein
MNEYYKEYNKNRVVKKESVNEKKLMSYLKYKLSNMQNQDRKKFPEETFNLTIEDLRDIYLRQDGCCIYSRSKLSAHSGANIYKKLSFDRIDNNKPHTKNNLQMTSVFMNMLKGAKSDEEFRKTIQDE